jgi:hypothetical protein
MQVEREPGSTFTSKTRASTLEHSVQEIMDYSRDCTDPQYMLVHSDRFRTGDGVSFITCFSYDKPCLNSQESIAVVKAEQRLAHTGHFKPRGAIADAGRGMVQPRP